MVLPFGGGLELTAICPGCDGGELKAMSGEAVLSKADALGPGAGWALLRMSMGGPRATGVDVLPGPERRGGEYIVGTPVAPAFVGGGELRRCAFRSGLTGVETNGV